MRRSLLTLMCMTALGAAPALAQQTTGNIVGTVTDDSGAVLPGATVTVSGPTIVGTEVAVSSDKGLYRIAALPPGNYSLEVVMSGFGTQKRIVKLPLGQTIEENVSLKISQMSEEVNVVGEAPVVNAQSNEVSANYDKDWVRNAPIARYSFFDLINAAPGVNQSATGAATSTSFGGGSTDNSYQLDGTDFTAPTTGESWPYPNTDAIEEIQVLSL
ncbi:MAG TPA: carboxypeptidase-like regulatory domain-containing protein, partial [Vicinamibacteria bacterium]|nr:carboxypeptidase-like regulatory domain-containing protein [Vicinamibacteria bacterium]